MSVPVITIDGPSGSGKGTIAQWLSQTLDWSLLDSGALYRILAYAAEEQGVDLANEQALSALAGELSIEFDVAHSDGVATLLNGRDISKGLRTETCAAAASQVAALPAVRTALLARQRAFRQLPGLVADGRDMGTVVFPDASLKIYLTASAEERAERRYKQLIQKENSDNLHALFQDVLRDIKARDERDASRAVSPLKPADDAVIIDSTSMSIEQVCAEISRLVQEKGLGLPT